MPSHLVSNEIRRLAPSDSHGPETFREVGAKVDYFGDNAEWRLCVLSELYKLSELCDCNLDIQVIRISSPPLPSLETRSGD
jgi:hypothetical protein